MKTLRLVAATALVSSVFALSASAAEKEWWNVDFENPTPGGTNLVVGVLGPLTNDAATMAAGTVQPYTNGVWSAVDSDESYVTNEFNPSGSFGGDNCLRLDTQGNDLTWTPSTTTNNVKNVVDADLYLVGSDSAPAPADFDTKSDVQAAIYLKNEGEDEPTNSVLCVYVYDDDGLTNHWQELEGEGVELEDNAWAKVQVTVDHSGGNAKVSVKVNGKQMHARGGVDTEWTLANPGQNFDRVSSVSFRGTGAVDNFVGTIIEELVEKYEFTAQVYIGNVLQQEDVGGMLGNLTRREAFDVGTPALFEEFVLADYGYDDSVAGELGQYLSKVEIVDAATESVTTYTYSWDENQEKVVPDSPDANPYVTFAKDPDDFHVTGYFSVSVPTANAVSNMVIAKIYFTDLNAQQAVNPVDPGDSMSAAEKALYAPAGVVTETDDQTGVTTTSFVVHFKGVAGVTYELLSSTTLTLTDEQWKAATVEDSVDCDSNNEDDVLELKAEIDPNDTAKFFKIGASATQP